VGLPLWIIFYPSRDLRNVGVLGRALWTQNAEADTHSGGRQKRTASGGHAQRRAADTPSGESAARQHITQYHNFTGYNIAQNITDIYNTYNITIFSPLHCNILRNNT